VIGSLAWVCMGILIRHQVICNIMCSITPLIACFSRYIHYHHHQLYHIPPRICADHSSTSTVYIVYITFHTPPLSLPLSLFVAVKNHGDAPPHPRLRPTTPRRNHNTQNITHHRTNRVRKNNMRATIRSRNNHASQT